MPEGPDTPLRWYNLNLGQLTSYLVPMLLAIICFGLAYYLDDKSHFGHELARDLGIAFVVAVAVTIIYEVYARRRYERSKFISALQLIMDEVVHPRVWEAVRKQVIERNVIREDNEIILSLEEMDGLGSGQMVLRVDYNYKVRSLRSGSVAFELHHYLDDHIHSANLPKFERIEIGSRNYSGTRLKEKIENGVFSTTLNLEPRHHGSLSVRTRRKEITYVPGSYNLFMNELCAGMTIILDRIPPGIVAFVRGPHSAHPLPMTVGPAVNDFCGDILLPGQGFEFRFAPEVATSAAMPLFAAQPRSYPKVALAAAPIAAAASTPRPMAADPGLLERRTRLERRGTVKAVPHDRRNNPERRRRKAS